MPWLIFSAVPLQNNANTCSAGGVPGVCNGGTCGVRLLCTLPALLWLAPDRALFASVPCLVHTAQPTNPPTRPAPSCVQTVPGAPTVTGFDVGSTLKVKYTTPTSDGGSPIDYYQVFMVPKGSPSPNPNNPGSTPFVQYNGATAPSSTDITSLLQPGKTEYDVYVFAHNSQGFSAPGTKPLNLAVSVEHGAARGAAVGWPCAVRSGRCLLLCLVANGHKGSGTPLSGRLRDTPALACCNKVQGRDAPTQTPRLACRTTAMTTPSNR